MTHSSPGPAMASCRYCHLCLSHRCTRNSRPAAESASPRPQGDPR